jgi:hypothetical protein
VVDETMDALGWLRKHTAEEGHGPDYLAVFCVIYLATG